ncbi:MAG: hypothetical protein LBC02_08830 [Planctomycetaceae bacterium]|nr:hypothetical protein [Planctomycetaceae bacterium]
MAGGNEAKRSDRMKLPKDSVNAMFFDRSKRSLRCASFTPAMFFVTVMARQIK